jgi:phage terminase small subunit
VRPANQRREKFVDHYLSSGNATAAAIAAGYSPASARVQGSQLLTNPAIQQAIEKARSKVAEKAELEAAEVLRELAVLAFSNVDHYTIDPDSGCLVLAEGAPPTAMRAVSWVKRRRRTITAKGQPTIVEHECEFRLWDKNKPLENLARHFGLLLERFEINLTQQHILAMLAMSDLQLSTFLKALESKQPEHALRLLPGGQDASPNGIRTKPRGAK